jgi:hypothetical protein
MLSAGLIREDLCRARVPYASDEFWDDFSNEIEEVEDAADSLMEKNSES